MQTTPPSSPIRTPCGSPCGSPCGCPCGSQYGSPCGFQIRSCFQNSSGTPPRVLFPIKIGSPEKLQKLENGRGQSIVPPEAPRKHKKSKGPIDGLPVLSDDFCIHGNKLGEGSFGTAYSVSFPGTPDVFAMKEVAVSGRSSPSDLRQEAANFGAPGCVPGFAMSSPHGDKCYMFSPICDPLDKTNQINGENIEEIINLIKGSIMKAPFRVITDAGLSNMGIARAGTPTPVLGENGLPCAGDPIYEVSVLFFDIGNNDPNDCNPMTSALFDENEMNTEEERLKYRKFKCDLLAALLRNRILDIQVRRDECDIAREICEIYGYTYARGNRKQSEF